MLSLRETQAWMQKVVTCPDSELESVMDHSKEYVKQEYGLDSESRLWIYRGMYPIRMVESLQIDFPGVRHALGSDGFEALVLRYIEEHPSSSWTLNSLGHEFPGFIATDIHLRGRKFLADLAQLELALAQVFDEPEQPALTPAGLQTLSANDWENLRLRPRATSRLLRFSYPVSTYLFQADNGLQPKRPKPEAQRVLILRKTFQMNRVLLPVAGYFVLQELFKGEKLARAIERLAGRYPEVGSQELQRWFQQWGDWGIFLA